MTLRCAALVLLLVGYASHPQGKHPQHAQQFVYGRWTITKFLEVSSHAGQKKEQAQAQIGKTLTIGVHSFDHDRNFLWFDETCRNPSYRIKETDGGDGSLGFYGLEQEESGLFLVVCRNKREMYSFEVAKNQELAVYYDGWFFFLQKTKGTTE